MLPNEATLREEFQTLHGQLSAELTASATKNNGVPKFTAEEKAQRDAKFARMDAIQAAVEQDKRLAEYAFSQNPAANKGPVKLPTDPAGKKDFDEEAGALAGDFSDYKDAVNQFARTGERTELLKSVQRFKNSKDKNLRQLYTITTSTGTSAYLPKSVLPPKDVRRLPNAWRRMLALMDMKPITRVLTESISLPVEDDTANIGQAQSQSATTGTTADSDATGSVTLNPTLYSSKQIWVANTVVNALDFDIIEWILPRLDKRLAKSQESAWTATVKTNATIGVTTASHTAITYAEWLTFEHSLNAAYRDDAGFILEDSIYKIVRGMVDSNNRPIMDLDPANKFMSTIHGKPVVVGEYFDAAGAASVSGAFVSAEAILMLDAGMQRIARYVLVPANPDQTGFELFANGDMNFISKGTRTLKMT